MADQVVTLIDNEGVNLYPVAGALKSGSVSTSTINDDAVTAAKIDFSTLSGNYSTSEQDTGYTWTDGSKIYKKTFSGTSGAQDGSTKSAAHGINNFGVLIKAEGYIYNSAGSQYWVIPTSFGSEGWAAIRVDNTNLYLNVYGDAMAQKAFAITLYYTKSS